MDRAEFDAAQGPPFDVSPAIAIPFDTSVQSLALRPLRAALSLLRVQVPRGVTLAMRRGWPTVEPTQKRIAAWRRATPVGPMTFREILLSQLPDPCAALVNVGPTSQMPYYLIVQRLQEPLAFGRRVVVPKEHYAFHDYLYVLPGAQRTGLATRLLHNSVVLYDKLGVTEIRMTAGLSAGAIVWPKMGFEPTPDEWGRLRRAFTRMRRLPAKVGHLGDEARVQRVLHAVATSDNPKALWLLSDLRGTDGSALGPLLLKGLRWRGRLLLRDVDSRARFNAYALRKLGPQAYR